MSFGPLARALGMTWANLAPPALIPLAHEPPKPRAALLAPERGFVAGTVRWYDYGVSYKHVEHATRLAGPFVYRSLSAPPPPAAAPRSGPSLLPLALLAWRLLGAA